MSDFFDADVEEDGDFDDYLRQATSEHTVFLVDAGPHMQEVAGIEDMEGYNASDTYIDVALRVVHELMKQHIISSPKDQMGLVFFNAETAKNEGSFASINVAVPVEELTASKIREVDALRDTFDTAIGSSDDDPPGGVRDGLWAAAQILQADTSKATKRVMVLTNEDDPFRGSPNEAERRQILVRASNLHEANIEVELFNLTSESKDFDMGFWSEIIKNPDDELGTQTWTADPLKLEDLVMNVRKKSYKKRALASLFWYLGPDFKFAVKLFALVQKATPSKSVAIDLRTNDVLKATGAYIDNDTGAIIERITKYSFPKDEKQAPRFPKVIITEEEKKAFKELRSPGLRLIGFKSADCLKNYHQLRGSTFVYPDEKTQPGSATAFIALHDRLLKRGLLALCSLVRNKSAEPRMVAALAQQEEIDDRGNQVTPPGLNLIYLPYKDDIRHPETDVSFIGPPTQNKASKAQIRAAEDLLSKLKIAEFAPGCLPNPHLQRHFQVLEALALGDAPPEMKPEDDFTVPEPFDDETAAAIIAFRDAVYGKGNEGPLKTVLKRKAEQESTNDLDAKELVKSGKLSKLTVKVLMELCRKEKLSSTGRKQELIDRLTDRLGG